ncbi:amino acid ABC transporter permease [Amphibacillus cookii]|uniref:amino acid ABC transporter permease n=1 Tax=Amphibacillus cookii TaxID=767787 RepID=UPI00195C99AC|nr:amino acid ABC transporter permease [Amphibacillus cookii]MBM7540720.1 His/Glu/Gln/Arg/opine family amino acid ABC transporter permease subunit [Amphibacillus cookii]
MQFFVDNLLAIISVAPVTILLAVTAMVIGATIGLGCAIIQIYKLPFINRLVSLYLAVIRGTPVLILMFLAYYGIPQILFSLAQSTSLNISVNAVPPIFFAIIALSLDRSVYLTQAIRSAIQSIPNGQLEACYSVGMTTFQAYKRVIIPQALVIAIPNVSNLFLGAVKESSLASIVSVVEMMNMSNIQAVNSYRYTEIFIIVSLLYWGICLGFEFIFSAIERRLMKGKMTV